MALKLYSQRDEITLYLRSDRAHEAGLQAMRVSYDADRFDVIPCNVRLEDGTTDQGFKVRITTQAGGHIYL